MEHYKLFLETIDLPEGEENTRIGYLIRFVAYHTLCINAILKAFPNDWKNHSQIRLELLDHNLKIYDLRDELLELGIFSEKEIKYSEKNILLLIQN